MLDDFYHDAEDEKSSIAVAKVIKRHGPSRVGQPMKPVRLRLSPQMIERIDAAAKAKGWTSSTYMRCAIASKMAMTDDDQIQVVRRYGGAGPDAAALIALRMQLHELGGLLTQLAKVSRINGQAAQHADAEHTLAEIRQAVGQVAIWQAERIE